ncbi:hypothetical protein, partial [Paractinoplanes toevensis]|uniref:hypothetical protein n=1 Tax=Paractinoplanes toevensis TaxID=571911 RepID=UPI001BB37C7A
MTSRATGTDLWIDRLSATLSPALDRGRIDLLLHRIAGAGLDDALADTGLPGGEWCLRRIDVPVRVDPAAGDDRIAAAWSAALAAAVRQALADGGGEADIVRYASVRAAAVDLVTSVAWGRWGRAWAWRQVGLLDAGIRPAPAVAIVAALNRSGADALGVLIMAAEAAGVAALHRALGRDGWPAAAAAVTGVRISPAAVEASPSPASNSRVNAPAAPFAANVRAANVRAANVRAAN